MTCRDSECPVKRELLRIKGRSKKAVVTYEIHTTYGNGRGSPGATCNKYSKTLDLSKGELASLIAKYTCKYNYTEIVILLIHEL